MKADIVRADEVRSQGITMKMGLTILVVALIASLSTWAAFSATTQNSGNEFATGTVELSDDDANQAMLSLSDAKPGDSDSSCIVVSYSGTLPATVRMYGTTTGSGLDQYLDLTVTRGTKSSPFDSCADFVAGPVVYSGTLAGYPGGYAGGIADAGTWTNGDSHAYRFQITVQDDQAAQGLTASQTFIWEARNL